MRLMAIFLNLVQDARWTFSKLELLGYLGTDLGLFFFLIIFVEVFHVL